MRASRLILLIAISITVLTAGISVAETIYVGDRLVVTLREIPEDSAPTIGVLKTDDPMELIEEGDQYFKVRGPDGLEGYIQKQYVTRNTPKTIRIAELQKELAQQKKQIADLKETLSSKAADIKQDQGELKTTISELEKALAESAKELEAANEKLAAAQNNYTALKKDAENVVAIITARDNLQKENDLLTDELNALREDNSFLLKTFFIKWFLAGAGVLFVGWLIGRSSRRKRRY